MKRVKIMAYNCKKLGKNQIERLNRLKNNIKKVKKYDQLKRLGKIYCGNGRTRSFDFQAYGKEKVENEKS